MSSQPFVYSYPVLFTINRCFEIQTEVVALPAGVGKGNRAGASLRDLTDGLLHGAPVPADYLVNPPAGVFQDGFLPR